MSTFNELIDFTRSTTGTYLDSVVYGDEVVTNGDFSDGTTGWSAPYQSTISTVNNALRITATNPNPYATQYVVVEAGKKYVVTFNVLARSAGSTSVFFGSETGLAKTDLGSHPILPNDFYVFNVVATTDVLNIQFVGHSLSVGDYFDVDNVSVKEVIGGQVSGTPLLRTAAVDEPRLEYDAQGNALGLLIEEQRTNIVTQSAVTSADWIKVGAVTTTDREDNALGVFNGTSVTSGGASWSRVKRNIVVTSGTVYSGTFFYKQGTSERVHLVMRANSLESVISGEQGSIATVSNSAGVISVESEEDYGGIRKVTFKWTAIYTGSAEIGIGAGTNDVGEDVILYAAQLEAGQFPTSYIPTSGSAVTRTHDFCSVPISRFFYNTSEGSLFVVFDIATSQANKGICTINNSASPTANRVDLRSQGTAQITSDSVNFDGLNVSSFNRYTTNKAAFAFKSGDSALVKNGGTVDTLSSVFTLPSFDILRVGSIDVGIPNLGSGHIKSIQYYPLRVTDAKLQELTS